MAKRIVSGIFILTALGALGVILAGAMTSGEQLIVRFLTAVTVAALALYVISDLRLQNDQEEPPTERKGSAADRSMTQATAVMATVTASHRKDRLARRSRETTAQQAPNFEAIEPVTTRSRAIALADPTEAVTGSRLVPPGSDQFDRIVPPHPTAGHRLNEETGRHSTWSTRNGPTWPTPTVDRVADLGDPVADLGDPVTGPIDPAPQFMTPPDERAQETLTGSVIATRSFTYSGRLHSLGVHWPPSSSDDEEPAESFTDNDPEIDVGAIDAPTAELPALTGLTFRDADDDPLLDLLASKVDDADDDLDGEADRPEPKAYLFAVDTADILLMEPADAVRVGDEVDAIEAFRFDASEYPVEATDTGRGEETVESGDGAPDPVVAGQSVRVAEDTDSTWPMAGDPPAPTLPPVRPIQAAHYTTPPRTDYLDLRDANDVVTTGESSQPGPAVPSSSSSPADKLTAAIRSGEIQVINSLISQGMLSTTGPITDRDVRTMVYVAFTSNELRKLILAGGTPDGIRAGDLDLGDVELFDESRFAPPPKRLYPGPPTAGAGGPEPMLDLVALEEESASVLPSGSPVDHDLDTELVPRIPTPRHLYRRVDADRVDQ